jgi:hypothetical protein
MFRPVFLFLILLASRLPAPNGQRTSATESQGRVVNYAYDRLNGLTTETVSSVVIGAAAG